MTNRISPFGSSSHFSEPLSKGITQDSSHNVSDDEQLAYGQPKKAFDSKMDSKSKKRIVARQMLRCTILHITGPTLADHLRLWKEKKDNFTEDDEAVLDRLPRLCSCLPHCHGNRCSVELWTYRHYCRRGKPLTGKGGKSEGRMERQSRENDGLIE
ncbi:hypothetical protein SK128_009476 [Halocaridina rubra]|uniref:Uncharacterized protein n=1 Tax=Halocaridina rubra TaxID=373956 RepID=A0AAN9A2V4_HALRR